MKMLGVRNMMPFFLTGEKLSYCIPVIELVFDKMYVYSLRIIDFVYYIFFTEI